MEVSDNYIDVNIPNIVTITVMAAVGMLIITALTTAIKSAVAARSE